MSTPAWRPHAEVEIIVGTPPGGGQDRPARALMRVLEADRLVTVPMKLTNIPGKGGGNAWDALRNRAGDPHVLSISSAPLLTNRLLGVTDYDHAELTPVATLYAEYLAFVVRADSKIETGAAFLDALKCDAGALEIAIATALGTTNHLALGQIVRHLDGDPRRLRLRVFESALHAVADVVQGNAGAGAVSAASAVKDLKSGALRALAVSAPKRMGGVFEACRRGPSLRCRVRSVNGAASSAHRAWSRSRWRSGKRYSAPRSKVRSGTPSWRSTTGPTRGWTARGPARFWMPSANFSPECCATWD